MGIVDYRDTVITALIAHAQSLEQRIQRYQCRIEAHSEVLTAAVRVNNLNMDELIGGVNENLSGEYDAEAKRIAIEIIEAHRE